MIWGLTESTFTTVHVVLSLIGIGSGLLVMFGLLGGKERPRTAKALGLTIPPSLLQRADEVIQ